MRTIILLLTALLLCDPLPALSQSFDHSQLDPKPYDPETEPDIDLFISSWKESTPKQLFGTLIVHNIFTKSAGDQMKPHKKGAVLTFLNRFAYASLTPHESTKPSALKEEQVVFYVDGGKGMIESGGTISGLHNGVGVLMPPEIEFTIHNTGEELLTMYLIAEPVPKGFVPNKEMSVKDDNTIPFDSSNGHWSHIAKPFFFPKDGTAVMGGMAPVWFDKMTMGQPHSHKVDLEEIWFVLEGDIHLLLGKQLRKLPVGSAYKIPPNYKTPHSNINITDKPVKLFWFIKRSDPEPPHPSYAMLYGESHNPDKHPDIDIYTGNWRESVQFHTHGMLIEREILARCDGDTLRPRRKSAVLKYMKSFTHATLLSHNSTAAVTPKGEQELFYILSGKGTVIAGGETHEIYPGVIVFIPEGISFTMHNTDNDILTMYHIVEPVPEGFRPKNSILVRDEAAIPIETSSANWNYRVRNLVKSGDGLSELDIVASVTMEAMTFAQPHSMGEGTEKVWAAVEGEIRFLMGQQIRDLPPDTAYMVPPDGKTPHANFNTSDKPIKLLYFARLTGHDTGNK